MWRNQTMTAVTARASKSFNILLLFALIYIRSIRISNFNKHNFAVAYTHAHTYTQDMNALHIRAPKYANARSIVF